MIKKIPIVPFLIVIIIVLVLIFLLSLDLDLVNGNSRGNVPDHAINGQISKLKLEDDYERTLFIYFENGQIQSIVLNDVNAYLSIDNGNHIVTKKEAYYLYLNPKTMHGLMINMLKPMAKRRLSLKV
ncbi:hypothetical protein [Sporolactobacillus sp. KGMB 08714]|uniref:hypothetical protein n=1 Tax=Sporolactobacillus sp. KGMB 08714 TaxID=3064704 RepID=UPI002FBD5823